MFSQWNINIIFKCQLFTNFFKNKETVLLKIQKYISWKENPQDEISDYLISYLPTKRSEKLCLQWNDFQDNIISAFRNLREDNDFEDKYDLAMCCIWWLCLTSKPAT